MRWKLMAGAAFALTTGCAAGHAAPRQIRRPASHGPAATPSPAFPRPRSMVFHGARDSGMVALTFDADMTPAMRRALDSGRDKSAFDRRIITTLHRTRTPATIFATGMWIERYGADTRRLAGDPLIEFGNHSYRHSAFTTPCYGLPALKRSGRTADIRHTMAILDRAVPHHTPYFRFPGGCHDKSSVRTVIDAGLTPIQWDVISGDAFGHDPNAIVRTVLGEVKGGSIVIMHLNGAPNAPETYAALPQIIKGLHKKGLRPVLLSELLAAR